MFGMPCDLSSSSCRIVRVPRRSCETVKGAWPARAWNCRRCGIRTSWRSLGRMTSRMSNLR
eukprot:11665055-Alexandrium_andersonii.AAC.1